MSLHRVLGSTAAYLTDKDRAAHLTDPAQITAAAAEQIAAACYTAPWW